MKINQQQKILHALKMFGKAGLNSYYATYQMRVKQAPTRVWELKHQGYLITEKTEKDRSVTWFLIQSPIQRVQNGEEKQWQWDFSGNTVRKIPNRPIQENLL